MKKGKSLKESIENSLKHKSINDNSAIDNKMKLIKKSQKLSEISSIKRNKKYIINLKNNHNNNKILEENKPKKKYEKSKINKNSKLIHEQRNEASLKDKTENTINKKENKKKSLSNLSPSSIKNIKKEKNSLLIINTSSRVKKERNIISSKKTFQNFNYTKRKNNYLKEELLTIQNTLKNRKIQKIKTIKNFILKNTIKSTRKLSYDSYRINIKLSSKEIKIRKKNYSLKLKQCNKIFNEKEKNNLNQTFNKTLKNGNNIVIPGKNKNNDKTKLIDRIKKNKIIFNTMTYRNKKESIRNKFTTPLRNKKINSFTMPRTKKYNNSKSKSINEFSYNNNSILNITTEKISIGKIKPKQYHTIKREKKLLNIENNSKNKKLNNKIIQKKNIHYLNSTVSTLNKIMKNKKKESNKNDSNDYKRSKTIGKEIKSIKRDYKDKNKDYLIHTKTTSRFKIKEKNNNKLDNRIYNNISNSNFSTLANTKRINNKNIDDFEIIKELGKGSYATVKLVINKNNNNKYAMKIYSKESILEPQKYNIVNNEIKILKQLHNINIVKLYDVIETEKDLYLIMEYIDGISLLDTIKKEKNRYIEEQRALKIFAQILKANIYCQNKNICHRDIKLENILVINDDVIKLIDFGFAIKANKETYQTLFCGSPSYMAPEIINKERYIAQYSDIWSLGVLFFSMLYGKFPFKAKTQDELFTKINKAQVVFPNDIKVNNKIKKLLTEIFVKIPSKRPSLQEILDDILLLIK